MVFLSGNGTLGATYTESGTFILSGLDEIGVLYYPGDMDEVRAYDRALTSTEVFGYICKWS